MMKFVSYKRSLLVAQVLCSHELFDLRTSIFSKWSVFTNTERFGKLTVLNWSGVIVGSLHAVIGELGKPGHHCLVSWFREVVIRFITFTTTLWSLNHAVYVRCLSSIDRHHATTTTTNIEQKKVSKTGTKRETLKARHVMKFIIRRLN